MSEETIIAWGAADCTCDFHTRLINNLRASDNWEHEDTCPQAHLDLPSSWHVITRSGTTKREGGQGTTWACSCDVKKQPCKHLRALYQGWVTEDLRYHSEKVTPWKFSSENRMIVRLPPDSDAIRAVWAAKMLRADAQPEK